MLRRIKATSFSRKTSTWFWRRLSLAETFTRTCASSSSTRPSSRSICHSTSLLDPCFTEIGQFNLQSSFRLTFLWTHLRRWCLQASCLRTIPSTKKVNLSASCSWGPSPSKSNKTGCSTIKWSARYFSAPSTSKQCSMSCSTMALFGCKAIHTQVCLGPKPTTGRAWGSSAESCLMVMKISHLSRPQSATITPWSTIVSSACRCSTCLTAW